MIPNDDAFYYPGPNKAVRLPAPGAGTEAMMDDHGFKDLQQDYDVLEEEASDSPVLRKVEPALPDAVDPNFDVKYDDAKHGEYLRNNLSTGHLPPEIAARLISVLKKHWRVFDPDGLKCSVIGYECDIETGDAKPILCGNVNYGPRESVIMRKHIKALLNIDHIDQIRQSLWMFPALLAAKPHQETIYDITDFKWRFCVNYINLNQITMVIVFPYP